MSDQQDSGQRIRRRIALAAAFVVCVYSISYATLRVTGTLTRYHYGLYPDPAAGRPEYVIYNEIRHREFDLNHPLYHGSLRRSVLEVLFRPLVLTELWLRGFRETREVPS